MMQYTILKLSKMAGVSTRTLRYYDEIGLLKPARINSSGYRIYGSEEVDFLQQILLFREMDIPLLEIKQLLNADAFETEHALRQHLQALMQRRDRVDVLIRTVTKSLAAVKGECTMNDQDKFEGFKQKLIDDNERAYGAEIREKYGDEAVNRSNQKFAKMSKEEYEHVKALEEEVKRALGDALEDGNPAGELAQKVCKLHKEWLSYMADYSKEYHLALVQMYVDDPRFKAYYDSVAPGATEFLRDAVVFFHSEKL